jgi:predicted DsbA family dithiol-disulfide isomerase
VIEVEPGTIVFYGDIACPWATVAVERLHRTRARLGLDGDVRLDHRCFALEIKNRRPTPRRTLAAEIPVAGALEPDLHWQVWQADDATWPVTTLPALEAVQAAKEQSPRASEELDLGLRRALFCDSSCVSMRHVILDVATSCATVDVDHLRDAIDNGRARSAVISQARSAEEQGVDGSPHLFLPDGSTHFNPGVELHWEGQHGRGFPVVDADDPSVYDGLVKSAATAA